MFGISTTKIAIFGGVVLLLVGVFVYMRVQINSLQSTVEVLKQNNAILETSVQTQRDVIEAIEKELDFQNKNQKILSSERRKISVDQKEDEAEIESYRRRLRSAAKKRPTLIELRVNKRLNALLRQFREATESQNSSR